MAHGDDIQDELKIDSCINSVTAVSWGLFVY